MECGMQFFLGPLCLHKLLCFRQKLLQRAVLLSTVTITLRRAVTPLDTIAVVARSRPPVIQAAHAIRTNPPTKRKVRICPWVTACLAVFKLIYLQWVTLGTAN